jgi:hypothetical protein
MESGRRASLRAMNTKAKFLALALLLGITSFAQASTETWTCGEAQQDMSLNEWSKLYMQAEPQVLPMFMGDWIIQVADRNHDQVMTADEQNLVMCEFSKMLKAETGADSTLVKPDGHIDWQGYYAGDKTVSQFELRFALSVIAEKWNQKILSEVALVDVDKNSVLEWLKSGVWTISEKDVHSQADMMGVDMTRAGQLDKQLGLAYRLSELKSKAGDQFPALLSLYLQLAEQQKSMPYFLSINSKNQEIMVGVNQVTITEVGVPGSNRYYVMQGTPVKMAVGKKTIWYQPSDQETFLMTRKSAYPDTSKYQQLLRKKLSRLCQSQAATFEIVKSTDVKKDELEKQVQNLMNQMADSFLADVPKVVVQETALEMDATAYYESKTGTITLSLGLIQGVAEKASVKDLNRHLVFLVMQEFLHSLQHQIPDYEMNVRMYNAPMWAFVLFGDVGYREYYLGQPMEHDAHLLAGQLAQGLEDSCQSLAPTAP